MKTVIFVKRIVNELNLEIGEYSQALVLSDGQKEVNVPLTDDALEIFITSFRDTLGTLKNPEELKKPSLRTELKVQSQQEEPEEWQSIDLPEEVDDSLTGWTKVEDEQEVLNNELLSAEEDNG